VTVNDTLRMRTGDDIMRLELTYAPIRSSYSTTDPSGTSQGYILIARDVTRIKSLEEERDEFISVVSHELRTPVTVAEGTISNAQLMVERNISDKNALEKSLEEAHEQVIYLAKMVNDLSTLSRAERGVASETEKIDVAELAHGLFAEYHPQAEKAGLHFNLELSPRLGHVEVSRLYLHELLQNFITNSIKYTREGSITLKVKRTSDTILFEVSDTGIGISKSDQAKVFNKFYRSEDYRTRETSGTGLGLYVTRKLAKKMGTSITLKSRLNHGSTFSFSLPAA
jgi:signal transduction histidine kinase